MEARRLLRVLVVAAGSIMLLAGCGMAATEPGGIAEPPTVSPHFAVAATLPPPAEGEAVIGAPTVSSRFRLETATPWPTRTSLPLATPRPTWTPTPEDAPAALAGVDEETFIIYDDEMASGWSLEHSEGVAYDLADSRYAYSGEVSVAVTPQQDFGALFFTVRQDAEAHYASEQVVGVRFWLNSGAAEIAPADLALTIVGSDAYPYYVADDDSVSMGEEQVFSETRLYDLSVNRVIPPETWVEISVKLDDLLYDPEYMFVTGFYIKNDADFDQTFFVDQVALIVIGEME